MKSLNLSGDVYKIPIYFLSNYEKNSLLAIQELLNNPEKYFTEIYRPYTPVDTYRLVYEGQKPSFHIKSDCPRLKSDYKNFEIPKEITEKGPDAVKEFRQWFEGLKHLLDKPDVFAERLGFKYGIVTNPKAITGANTGPTLVENLSKEEVESRIDSLLKDAGKFYNASDYWTKNILKKHSQYANRAYKPELISNDVNEDKQIKELLKAYDEKYKRPLKRFLIEYYRLKLNPEIKMEGRFLEQIGFKECAHCHGHYAAIETILL